MVPLINMTHQQKSKRGIKKGLENKLKGLKGRFFKYMTKKKLFIKVEKPKWVLTYHFSINMVVWGSDILQARASINPHKLTKQNGEESL